MYKKLIFGLTAIFFAGLVGLANFDQSARALDCIDAEQCPSDSEWLGEPGTEVVEDESEDDSELEADQDPEMWPVYLCFGAIGATFLLVVIINLSARKYNKK